MRSHKWILKGIAVVAASLGVMSTLTTSASAAVQFPGRAVSDGGGMTLRWSGEFVSPRRAEDITLQFCDLSPEDKHRASVQLQAYVVRGTGWRIETAPTVFQIPIGDAECKMWRNVFITYFEDGDRIDHIRAQLFYSDQPSRKWWTHWVENPFNDG